MKLFFVLALLFLTSTVFAEDMKKSDLAGTWYPADKAELADLLGSYLDSAKPIKIEGQVLAIISPHAGYQFSGPVAAYGFKVVNAGSIKTVIVIGFSHRRRFDGISVYAKGGWSTPLGDIAIDEKLAAQIVSKNKRLRFEPGLFDEENSVEMQMPFIELAFKGARVVPVAFGTQDYGDAEILADALATVLKDRNDVLIVASTDLSHFHPYQDANAIDKNLIKILEEMKARKLYDAAIMGECELCGMMPVTATLLTAEKLGVGDIEVLKYANSGDTFGDKKQVVGYLSAAIYKKGTRDTDNGQRQAGKTMLNDAQRKRLLQIARESIIGYVKNGKRMEFAEDDPVLNKEMGAFVTLHEGGQLRGCIGNMSGQGALYKTVADMAIEAATGDPRFPTLTAAEIGRIKIEISALSPLKKVAGYKDVKIPGDGVVVKSGSRSGVFLPQVADETGWGRDEFLSYLCAHKAGLPPSAWKDPKTEIYVFSAEVFGEKEDGR
ncbi:MAG: AmmeMemoRadiSam system protein B [Candidatus Omnitrophica bacterium]|nr:AmmeMemoRadiSam system protein B [Candidatus Omnitrophota bacterium]